MANNTIIYKWYRSRSINGEWLEVLECSELHPHNSLKDCGRRMKMNGVV
jgi:hypothetical protein